jgi:outer membrane protein
MKTLVSVVLMASLAAVAQTMPSKLQHPMDVPPASMIAAPHTSELPFPISGTELPQAPSSQAPGVGGAANSPQNSTPPSSAGAMKTLSIKDAELLALKNNPQISVARLTALASHQVTTETRSTLWPTAVADFTGVDSNDRRIAAGSLNNPVIYERAAAGATVTQLITDFGRSTNLVSSAKLNEKAENENAIATQEQIRLAVDQSFYSALQAHSITRVAEETVKSRQTVADQIQALFQSKLKSELDLSFANVNLAQAKLLLLDAQNNENAAYASLAAVLGFANLQNFRLVEDTSPLSAPPADIDSLISDAFSKRPELLALNYEYESARKFQTAERDLAFPTVRAVGAIGDVPAGNAALAPNGSALSNWYGAVGANIEVPIFNGFLLSARAQEAKLKTQAASERLRDLRDRISRDVRTSWLNANTAHNRLAVSQQLLDQSNLALDLAQTRYKLGLGSIVELSQSQLQQTQAEIGNTQAGYDYRLALAVLRFQTAGF